jgi:peptidoglycan/xylan/chitin deacetylase (PgdA/CDA1 family)
MTLWKCISALLLVFLIACTHTPTTPPIPTVDAAQLYLGAIQTVVTGVTMTAAAFSPTPAPTATATFRPTPTFTPTPPWTLKGPGELLVPIFIYHHIEDSNMYNPYYVSLDNFEKQLGLLREWGYTTISTTLLVQALTQGALLPPRPVLLTFDDANEDIYTHAFPLMKKYGFTGVLYLPYNYIGQPGYLSVEEIKEMVNAGWEVGSHSISHPDLRELDETRLRAEIVDSRRKLEELLGVPVLTFAYPFGYVSDSALRYAIEAGYIAAMGASGYTANQWRSSLYYLQRISIHGDEHVNTFIRFLPWQGPPESSPQTSNDTP